ncbi:hypothetical protein MKZ38_003776 [Zalerion maritima]|uniref:Uncharacterized protein n=1 Tax=Zalerion maritima TaxID=339359 RepID=A0AAD5RNQ6_9PEZI|nr:hypothetical protein MKZ38_003776 [Zalerion maritima]
MSPSTSGSASSSPAPSSIPSGKLVPQLIEVVHQLVSSSSFETLEHVFHENQRLKSENDDHTAAYRATVKELSQAYTNCEELTARTEEQRKQLASLADGQRKQLASLANAQHERDVATGERDSAMRELREIRKFCRKLGDEDLHSCFSKCNNIRKLATDLITCFFARDTNTAIYDRGLLTALENHPYLNGAIPLLASNTHVAREMRVAALTAFFAHSLCTHIFLPFPIFTSPSSTSQANTLSSTYPASPTSPTSPSSTTTTTSPILTNPPSPPTSCPDPTLLAIFDHLYHLSRTNPAHERHLRSTFLSLSSSSSSAQRAALSAAIGRVEEEVTRHARPFLGPADSADSKVRFSRELRRTCEKIAAAWAELQLAEWRVEPGLRVIYDDEDEWVEFSCPSPPNADREATATAAAAAANGNTTTTTTTAVAAAAQQQQPVTDTTQIHAVLFPSFTLILDDEEEEVASPGTVLLKAQHRRAREEQEILLQQMQRQRKQQQEQEQAVTARKTRKERRNSEQAAAAAAATTEGREGSGGGGGGGGRATGAATAAKGRMNGAGGKTNGGGGGKVGGGNANGLAARGSDGKEGYFPSPGGGGSACNGGGGASARDAASSRK